jgi:hypothetical protein
MIYLSYTLSSNAKYSSLLIPTVRILFLIMSTSISSYSGITTALLAPGKVSMWCDLPVKSCFA